MTRRPGSLGPFGKRQLFLCQGWDGTNPVVGTFDGHIYRHVHFTVEVLEVSEVSLCVFWLRKEDCRFVKAAH